MQRVLKNKRIVVLGLGRSGAAAARLCAREGALVTGTDARTEQEIGPVVAELRALGVALELGGHTEATFTAADLVVKSPGVSPKKVPHLAAAAARGIQIIGEVELCAPFMTAPVIGITGTNGKSTTTALIGHLLLKAGRKPFVGGNLGTPFADQVLAKEPVDATVLELSSYQIDDLDTFRADVSMVLNVTPDHLERYGTMDAYSAAKERLVKLTRGSGTVILNAGDKWTAAMQRSAAGRVVTFGWGAPQHGHVRAAGTTVTRVGADGADERYTITATTLRGAHNVENAMAAIEAVRVVGVAPATVQAGLDTFPGLPHRIESVRMLDGVEWVNDSKATNVDSVEKSLAAFAGPLHLILGGLGKGSPYAPLRSLLPGRVARIYTIGADAQRIEEELGDLIPVERAGTLETAVFLARGFSRPGDTVLLSPACASWDQFKNFEHRGETFRTVVSGLTEGA